MRRKPDPSLYALTIPGIEDLAADELTGLGATVLDTLKGFDKRESILLLRHAEPKRLARSALVEDLFALVLDAAIPTGRAAPKQLAAAMQRPALDAALRQLSDFRAKRGGRSYRVVARVAGRQAFIREDVDARFTRALGVLLPHWLATTGPASLELWVHIVGGRALAGVRLSGDELAQRRYKHAHLPASLKPTAARALVVLAGVEPGDTFIDVTAGAGTVLRERADAGRSRRVLGGDTSREAVAAARTNAGKSAALALWDATRLPLRDRSVDAVVSNPPYGRQHGSAVPLPRLYARLAREAARVLKPGGRCVLLTGEPALMLAAIPPALSLTARRRMLTRGLPVTAFVMVRL